MDYEITQIKPEYALQMHKIELECFSDPWSELAFIEDASNPLAKYFVACQNTEVLGYVGARIVLNECYITNIAIKPSKQRLGIGRVLMAQMLDFADSCKLEFVTLEVRPSNLRAIRLYESTGFLQIGTRTNYYENPTENAIIMTRFRNEISE